jgi:hypothetical protein
MPETLESIREAIIGTSSRSASTPFLMAIRAYTRWPVDAFSYEINNDRHERKLYWLQGNALGWLSVVGQTDTPVISGLIRPVTDIGRVTLLGSVDGAADGPGAVKRVLSISFRTPPEEGVTSPQLLEISTAGQLEPYVLDQTNKLIDAILDAVAGLPAADQS